MAGSMAISNPRTFFWSRHVADPFLHSVHRRSPHTSNFCEDHDPLRKVELYKIQEVLYYPSVRCSWAKAPLRRPLGLPGPSSDQRMSCEIQRGWGTGGFPAQQNIPHHAISGVIGQCYSSIPLEKLKDRPSLPLLHLRTLPMSALKLTDQFPVIPSKTWGAERFPVKLGCVWVNFRGPLLWPAYDSLAWIRRSAPVSRGHSGGASELVPPGTGKK